MNLYHLSFPLDMCKSGAIQLSGISCKSPTSPTGWYLISTTWTQKQWRLVSILWTRYGEFEFERADGVIAWEISDLDDRVTALENA